MKYALLLGRHAETELNRLPDLIQARLSKRILSLENDPRPQEFKKLSGRQEYRVRVGDYRIVYSIDDGERTVRIIAVGYRGEIYR